MNEAMACVFFRNALTDARNKNSVLETAGRCGCCGECTLENGCVLYKEQRGMPGERAFFGKLKEEFLFHMLGE